MLNGASNKKPGFTFWLLWSLSNAGAWSIFLAFNAGLGNFDRLRALWMAGILPGLLHWLIIRAYIRRGVWWAVVSAVIPFLMGLYVLLGGNTNTVFILLFVGLITTQCWLLGRSIRRAALWALVNAIAVAVTALISVLPLFGILLDASGDPLAWALLGILSGSVFGAIGGLGLLILLRYPKTAEEGTTKNGLLTPANIIAGLVVLIMLLAPFYAILQMYALQSRIYCDVLQTGMPRAEVNAHLEHVRPIVETGGRYGYDGTDFPYPESLKPYAADVVNFYRIEIQDVLLAVPDPGLGYDPSDNLTLISSDNRNYDLKFQLVQCPWTWLATWNTLFK